MQQHSFAYTPDALVVDDITKKPFHKGQKPVTFFRKVVQIHTLSGEWILCGYSGIGKIFQVSIMLRMHALNVFAAVSEFSELAWYSTTLQNRPLTF